MHKGLRLTIITVLSAFILLGGSGLVLCKMVCMKSGMTMISVQYENDCCEDESEEPSFEESCCDVELVYFLQSDFISTQINSVKAADWKVLPSFLIPQPVFNFSVAESQFVFISVAEPCPDPDLQPDLCVFRI
jgi:hypothetical protein